MSTKITITQKIKIWNFIFLSIQPIPYISCKFEQFWKKNGIKKSEKKNAFKNVWTFINKNFPFQFFFSKLFKFTWRIQNRLERKIKFQIFIFRVVNMVNFSINIEKKCYSFYILFRTPPTIHKNRIKTEGGGGSAYP